MLRSWDLGQLAPHLLAANTLIALALLFLGLRALGIPAGGRSRWRRLDFWVGLILLLAAAAAPIRYFTRTGAAETRVAFSEPVLVWMTAVIVLAGCYAIYLAWLLLRRSPSPATSVDERAFAGLSGVTRDANAPSPPPSVAMPAPADTEAAFADLAAALREQLSTAPTKPAPIPRSYSESEGFSLLGAQAEAPSVARLHAVSSPPAATIQLRIKRVRRMPGATGGNAPFACEARLGLTADDAELLRRHGLSEQVIFDGQRASGSAATAFRVTVDSLMHGHQVDCRNFAELLVAEQAFIEACTTLRAFLNLAAKLDREEEVLRF